MPIITAHTGCMNTIDNSLESLSAALQYGCQAVEVDVHLTSDGVPVLNHNSDIVSEDGIVYNLSITPYKTLTQIKQANGLSGIVKLSDFLEEARGKITVNLDIKALAAIPPTAGLVKEINMENDVMLTGCKINNVSFAKSIGLDLRYMLNADYYSTERMIEAVIRYGCGGININYRRADIDLIEKAHARYIFVCVWTVDDEQTAETVINMGVDSITTRRPDILSAMLNSAKK